MKRPLPPRPGASREPRRIRPTDPLFPWEAELPYPIEWTPNGDYMEDAVIRYNRELALAESLLPFLRGWSVIGMKNEKQGYTALHPTLLTPEGWRVALNLDGWKQKGRACFSMGCLYWQDRNGGLKSVTTHYIRSGAAKLPNEEITLAADTPPEKMARALLSRMYPAVKEHAPRLLARALDYEAHHWDTVDALNRAARALGQSDPTGGHSEFPGVYTDRIKIEGSYRGRLTLTFSAEVEDMEKLLRFMVDARLHLGER